MVEREGDKCRPPEQVVADCFSTVSSVAFKHVLNSKVNKRRKEGKKNINKQVKKKRRLNKIELSSGEKQKLTALHFFFFLTYLTKVTLPRVWDILSSLMFTFLRAMSRLT